MSDVVIQVENLSKKYILSHQSQEKYTALRDVMTNGVKNLGKKLLSPFTPSTSFGSAQDKPLRTGRSGQAFNPLPSTEDFYALRDVSFEIKQGDRVGIIGRNGAGKSTLLKILSRITEPTSGRIEITGRVASLLEVGTGFHPELTGRENIFLNGAILGMGKAEIKRKFDEIVDFAEVEKFLDTPVKRYSSGMYVRLAFAVAAHLEPEILIVDEVLAVGDVQFQKKCLGKMKKVGEDGRTVIFVSHNMEAISNLCTTGIFLEAGHMNRSGTVAEVIDRYLNNPEDSSNQKLEWMALDKKFPLSEIIKIHGYCIVDEDDKIVSSNLLTSKTYRIKITLEIFQQNPDIRIAFAIYYSDVMPLLTSSAHDEGQVHFDKCQRGCLTLYAPMPLNLLSSGQFSIELLSLVERCGWILPAGNESRLKFNYFRDIELNPYAQYRLGGVTSPLSPMLSWSAENPCRSSF